MSKIPINLYDKILFIDQQLNSKKSYIPTKLFNSVLILEDIIDSIINNENPTKNLAKLKLIINSIKEDDLNGFNRETSSRDK